MAVLVTDHQWYSESAEAPRCHSRSVPPSSEATTTLTEGGSSRPRAAEQAASRTIGSSAAGSFGWKVLIMI